MGLIDPELDKRLPDFMHMEAQARKRIPKFVFEYVCNGTGLYEAVERNRQSLARVLFLPRYSVDVANPCLETPILGQRFDYPFGIAPLGLGGLIWPHSALGCAEIAKQANIPIVLSNFATSSLESVAEVAGDNAWFQLYPPSFGSIEIDHLRRLMDTGYQTLVVTVDTPTAIRRPHDVRNGMSVPPRIDLSAVLQILSCPSWALAQLVNQPLKFENFERYVPQGSTLGERGQFLVDIMEGRVHAEWVKKLRDQWPGKLIVKGIMHPVDAEKYMACGADGFVVSNHGGRQFDAAPATADVVAEIRQAVGPSYPLIVDGGVRTGLDIARFLALGADFVLIGRAFAWGIAAAGRRGAAHVTGVLVKELQIAMTQMGCDKIDSLSDFLTCDELP